MRLLAAVTLVAAAAGPAGSTAAPADAGAACLDPDPPEYYAFPLVSTKKVPGSIGARGTAGATFVRSSPFVVAVSADGSFAYDLHLAVVRLLPAGSGHWVAWATTPQLDRVRRLGTLGEDGSLRGRVEWNKFLVVITLEETDDPEATTWSGPVALRGMSRSGRMHTMAGHGPFQQENCAAWGFGG